MDMVEAKDARDARDLKELKDGGGVEWALEESACQFGRVFV
jgi:hypothetical protein